MQTNDQSDAATFEQLTAARPRIIAELGKAIVGQHEVIEQILIALFAGGHCLITGAPGLAKTLLVKSIASSSRRISCRRISRAWRF
jgi:MoxR-like ATPase